MASAFKKRLALVLPQTVALYMAKMFLFYKMYHEGEDF